jgi:hypothetical protein
MKHLPLYYKVHTSPPNLSALDNSDAKLLTGDAPARVDLLPDEAGDWRWVTFWYGTTSEYLPFSRTTSIKIRNRNEGLQLTEDRQRSRVTVTNQDEIPYEWNYRIGVTLDADTGSNVSAIYTPGFSPSTTYVPRNYGKVTSPNRLVARLDNRYPLSDVNSGYSMTTTDIAEDVKPFEYAPPAFTGDWDSEKAMSISRWEDS